MKAVSQRLIGRSLAATILVTGLTLAGCGGDSGDTGLLDQKAQPTATAARRTEIRVTAVAITEEAARYEIDVKYPQTGLPVLDAKVKRLVDTLVTEIKESSDKDRFSAGKYMVKGTFTPSIAGPDIVSIRFDLYRYTGGAHGGNTIHGINFEVASGRELTLDDALAMTGLTLTQISEQATAQLRTKLGRDFLFPEGATAKRENYASFVVSGDQVTFFFQEYQVAPYAAGSQQVSLPRKAAGPR